MRTPRSKILSTALTVAGLVLSGCGDGGSSSEVRAGARGHSSTVMIHRDNLVGGSAHPWQVDLDVSGDGQGPGHGCGPVLSRKVHVANVSPGTKGPFEDTWTPSSAVAGPAGGDVIVTDSGPVHGSPFAGYIVAHTGPAVARVDALAGPHPEDLLDGMAPSNGWIVLLFLGPPRERALRITTRDGGNRQFFLRDAAGPCQPSPINPPTPACTDGQYRVTPSGDLGAGSMAAAVTIDPVGVPTCLLDTDVMGQMRLSDGRPDGGAVTSHVDWLLPQTVTWGAGSDCFNHTEIFTVRVGRTEASTTFPGGDCSSAPAGRAGSEHHPLGPTQ